MELDVQQTHETTSIDTLVHYSNYDESIPHPTSIQQGIGVVASS